MTYDGPAFFDDDAIFNTYISRRSSRTDNPNDTLEEPVFLQLVGDLTNRQILDLGCGDAAFGREAFTKGCKGYLGVEGSRNMVNSARKNLVGTTGEVVHATVEEWDYPAETFDLVVSRLVLHYVQDAGTVFKKINHTLVPGGRFVFTVEHPVITSCDRGWQGKGPRQDWLVDNYFDTGRRVTSWLGGRVVKYHRTVEDYFAGLLQASFAVESLREAEPKLERFVNADTYHRRRRIPLFLVMAGAKR